MRDIDMPPEKPPLLILRIIISKNLNAQLIACHNAQIIHGRTFNLQDFRRKQLVEFHDILIKHPIIVRVVVIFKDIVNAAACYKQNALVRNTKSALRMQRIGNTVLFKLPPDQISGTTDRQQTASQKHVNAVSIFHFNPHAGAAAGTNSDENGAARFPFSDTMGLREAHYKAR